MGLGMGDKRYRRWGAVWALVLTGGLACETGDGQPQPMVALQTKAPGGPPPAGNHELQKPSGAPTAGTNESPAQGGAPTAGTSGPRPRATAGDSTQAPIGGTAGTADDHAPDDSDAPSSNASQGAGGLDTPDAAAPEHVRATGPGDWEPGDYPPGLTEATYLEIDGVAGQGGQRQYKVHVPPSYDPQVPMAAVFCLHGLGQDALRFCINATGWPDLADEHGFILIMPNGSDNSWNGGTCCGGASSAGLDDLALVRAVFDEVGGHLNIDLDRVFATGLSNGGYMSYRLACEAADLFAAVAPGAGAIGINSIGGGTNPASDFTACQPSQPISVLDIHGTADPLIPYRLQAPSLASMAESAGCGPTPGPAEHPQSAGDTTCVSYAGCERGVEITGCSVDGGGHCWFGSEDCGTGGGAFGSAIVGANSDTLDNNTAIVEFFERSGR